MHNDLFIKELKRSKRLEVYGVITQDNSQMRSWKE